MLLQTKLHIPNPRSDTLRRPRLVGLLRANLDKPLILLSAPAGYGKTTLLAQFTAQAPMPVVWYQLDADDNDPAIFFEYLVECIARRFAQFGDSTRSLLRSIENVAGEWQRFLVVFINEIANTIPEDLLVVLEDYHVIDNPLIHGFTDRLLARAPPQLHLLLSTRSDPPISLARLRARRQMGEVRAGDLRFTRDEARAFLGRAADLDLSYESIESLAQETEGWAAALQLALFSLTQSQVGSIPDMVEGFRGTNRYLFDYLSEDVLAGLAPEKRSFLLGSSILEVMSPDLCNALLEIDNSREILDALEAQNLFTVALDDSREWYRYHRLFRDFLHEQLRRQKGDVRLRAMHLRAVTYFRAAGDIDRAIDHSAAAGALDTLAELVEEAAPVQLAHRRLQTVWRWIQLVPDHILATRPWVALYGGMSLAPQGLSYDARPLLAQARQAFAAVGNELGESRALTQLSRLMAFEGRYKESLELNHDALRRMPWADHEGRAQALRDQAELWLYLGNAVRALHAAQESLTDAQHLGDRAIVAERTIWKGVTHIIAGQLSEGVSTTKRGLAMLDTPDALGAHIAYFELGLAHLERWELDQACERYRQSLALCQKFQDSVFTAGAYTAQGMIDVERGEPDQAKAHYDAALAIFERTGMGNLMAEGTWNYLAEWHVRAGRYAEAEMCSRKAIALRGDEPGGLAWGTGWLPLAKVYLATDRVDEAEKILLDVEAASQTGGIALAYIDSTFRLGWLCLETGREDEAVLHLRRALSTAAPEGHRWMFLTYGHKAVPTLTYALKHKIEPAFVRALLCELGETASSALTEPLTHPDAEVQRHAKESVSSEVRPTAEAMAGVQVLRVTCFGDFKVTASGQQVGDPGWLATKAGDLFAYFITFRDSPVPRDRVLEALWPKVAPERSSAAFHSALYKMRQMLRGGRPGKFVRSKSGEYHLEKELFAIDADEFTTLYAHCTRHVHESMAHCESCVERLERALDLYRGDYLGNLYYDWALDEQRHLQAMYLDALKVLAEHHTDRGEYETAIAYYQQMLENDPLIEDVHRRVMRHYHRLGDRNQMIRQYRRLTEILADELDVEPMLETQELYRALMTGESADGASNSRD